MKNKKNILFYILLILFSLGLIYSIINIIIWKIDNDKIKKQEKEISENVEVVEQTDNDNTEIIEQKNIKDTSPYWSYIKMNLIDVDFNDLKKINSDIVGWIQVGGTNINYPFVQTTDNDYYLTHSFNKSKNQAGWVFLDYRNSKDEYDKNTIIYGHDLKSGTVFGSLKNIIKDNWLNNKENHIVKLSTPYENTLWQVFSVYKIPTTNDYLQTIFNSDEEFMSFANKLKKRSKYNFDVNITETDKILTLSSCYVTVDNKIVLHAKLIKREKRN